jgi:hypothetical protein
MSKEASEEYKRVMHQAYVHFDKEKGDVMSGTHPDMPKTKELHKAADENEKHLKTVVIGEIQKEVNRINSIEKPTVRAKEATALRQIIKTTVRPASLRWFKSSFDSALSQIKK